MCDPDSGSRRHRRPPALSTAGMAEHGVTVGVGLLAGGSALVAGLLSGALGVGGVILVPILISKPFVDVKVAIIASLLAYVPSGASGFLVYRRKGLVAWREAIFVCTGAAPGAALGAVLLHSAVSGRAAPRAIGDSFGQQPPFFASRCASDQGYHSVRPSCVVERAA